MAEKRIFTDVWETLGTTKALVVSTSAASQQVSNSMADTVPRALRLYNASGADVIIGFGTTSALAAAAAVAISTATGGSGHPLPSSAVEVIAPPQPLGTALWVAAYGTGTSGNCYVSPGMGL